MRGYFVIKRYQLLRKQAQKLCICLIYSNFAVENVPRMVRGYYFATQHFRIMKKISLLLFLCLTAGVFAERIEPIPFGDMESWTVRYVKESKLLGGNIHWQNHAHTRQTRRSTMPDGKRVLG